MCLFVEAFLIMLGKGALAYHCSCMHVYHLCCAWSGHGSVPVVHGRQVAIDQY